MDGLIFNKELAVSSVGQNPTQFIIILNQPLVIPPNSEIAWTELHFDPTNLDGNIANGSYDPTAVIYHSVKGFGSNFGKEVHFGALANGLGLTDAGVFCTDYGDDEKVIRNNNPVYYKLMNTKQVIVTRLDFQMLGFAGQPLVATADLTEAVDLIANYTFNIRTPATGMADFIQSLRQRWTDPLILDEDRKEIDIVNHNRTL
jgi:hypothetical protein